MNPITLQDFYNDPGLYRRLDQAARRERARLVHAGILRLRDQFTPRIHAGPPTWIARLG